MLMQACKAKSNTCKEMIQFIIATAVYWASVARKAETYTDIYSKVMRWVYGGPLANWFSSWTNSKLALAPAQK